MDYYECPQCKSKVKNEHRESHELYCINSIRASEYANLIPCEICNNLIQFEDFITHMENCSVPRIPPPPSNLINILNNFPPLNNTNIDNIDSNIDNNIDSNIDIGENTEDENLDQEAHPEVPQVNNMPNFYTLPLPPINNINTADIQNQINELLNNITNIDNYLGNNENNLPAFMNIIGNGNNDDYQNFTNLINQVGNVNVGIDDINKVTTIEVNTIDCPICGDKFEIVRRTACSHDFCFNCLNEWIKENKTCPICTTELKEF